MAENKKQHYNAKSYLSEFSAGKICDKSQIWIYDKDKNEIILKSIDNCAYKNYYYSIENEDGSRNNKIEHLFSKLEKEYLKLIKKIKNLIVSLNFNEIVNELNEQDRVVICEYIMMQYTRVPKMMEWIRKKSKDHHDDMEKKGLLKYGETNPQNTTMETYQYIMKRGYDNFLGILISKNINIEFQVRKKNAVITSDNPVMRFNRNRKNGIIYDDTNILFPLTKRCFINMHGQGNQLKILKHHDLERIDEFNKAIIENADKEVYTNDYEVILRLLKDKNINIKKPEGVSFDE